MYFRKLFAFREIHMLNQVSIIGAGQVAQHLVAKFFSLGWSICSVYARNIEQAKKIAQPYQALGVDEMSMLQQFDDPQHLIIIAVSDQAITSVIQQLSTYIKTSLVVHTSGSTDMAVLAEYYPRVGVFYPLQTFSIGREIDWSKVPLLLETSKMSDGELLFNVAQQFSSHIYQYSSAQRFSLHLSAVIACNFSNLCYDFARQTMDMHRVDFQLLAPLMLETAHKAIKNHPKDVQTGPAKRHDDAILQRHQQALRDLGREDMAEFYAYMSRLIQNR